MTPNTDEPDALRVAFANALRLVDSGTRLVLVIDALDQIQDRGGAPDLIWLPREIPANIRLIVSTLSGRPLNAIRERGWQALTVKPLARLDRETLIDEYLGQYSKNLNSHHRRQIANAPQSGNGLYLTTLLNELRLFGSHEELDQRIAWYLEAADPLALYRKVLDRWENDYGQRGGEGESIVAGSMSFLWASRIGLSETELRDILSAADSGVSRARWSALYCAASDVLVNRGGLLTFGHKFLRQAVCETYLQSTEEQRQRHRMLAHYFERQPRAPRQIDELPWQWREAKEWKSLAELLATPVFFYELSDRSEFDLKSYWARIEAESPYRMEEVYHDVINRPTHHSLPAWSRYAERIGTLLNDCGRLKAALEIHDKLAEYYRETKDLDSLQRAFGNKGISLQFSGELDEAIELFKAQECLCREIGTLHGIAASLGNQGIIHYSRGEFEQAMILHKEEEQIYRKLNDSDGLQTCLGNQANVLYARGDLDAALSLYKEEEYLCRKLDNMLGLQKALGHQALVLKTRGDLDAAEVLLVEKERLCLETGNLNGVQIALGNRGNILHARGNLGGAMSLFREQERICREIGQKEGLQASLGNQALILQDEGDLERAMALHKLEEQICIELGDRNALQAFLGNQALILQKQGDLDGALALHREKGRLCSLLGKKDGLQASLGNQALIFYNQGLLDDALLFYKQQEDLCRELGNKQALSHSFGNQALVYYSRGDLDIAMDLSKQQESLCRTLVYPYGLLYSLAMQAEILRRASNSSDAHVLSQEALRLAQEHGFRQLAAQIEQLMGATQQG